MHSVEMDESHRAAYNALYNSARAAFRAALAVGESEVNLSPNAAAHTWTGLVFIFNFAHVRSKTCWKCPC